MKTLYILLYILAIVSSASAQTNTFPSTGAAGIGTTTPNASSLLDITSTTQGVLFPRMTKAQRDAIVLPATGLVIYQTNSTPGLYYYDGSWKAVAKGPNKSLSNLTAPTAVNVDLLPGTDDSINIGGASFRWKDVNLFNLKFSDGTTQTTAATSYSSGSGISINNGVITNTGDMNAADDVNLSLSNLSATSINQSLLPNANNTLDLGSSANSWKDLYTDGSIYMDDVKFISNAGGSTFLGYQAGNLNAGSDNTGTGYQALYSNTTGDNNTANGYRALYSNTSGNYNTANGLSALYSSTTGASNTANGYRALYSNTTGSNNTANGYRALYSNTTASANTANGVSTLYFNTIGFDNTASGYQALYSNTTGSYNTASGYRTLNSNTTGSYNTANGYQTLYSNTTGSYNTAKGQVALFNNTTGSSNVALGTSALYSNTSRSNLVAIGDSALYNNGTGAASSFEAISNTAVGSKALYSNTTGFSNTANGWQALYSNTTGTENTANGWKALYSNTTGGHNTATGLQALYSNTTGSFNTATGYQPLYSNTTGNYNSAISYYALYYNTGGGENTATGHSALFFNTDGDGNTATGMFALLSNTTGDDNTANGNSAGGFNDNNTSCSFFGYDADQAVLSNFTNSTSLGNTSRITGDNMVRVGNSSVSSIGGYANWSNISDGRYKKNVKEDVPGLEFINQLKPITYTLDVNGISKFLGEDITGEEGITDANGNPIVIEQNEEGKKLTQQGRDEKSKIVYTGFIAQDVEAAANKIGYDFSGVDKPQNEYSLYGLRYAEFVVPLVKAVQELDEENENLLAGQARLKMENSALNSKVESSRENLSEMQQELENLKSEISNLKSAANSGFIKLATDDQQPTTPILGQNIPNPFDNSTLIPFRIPKDCKDASIMITNSSTSEVISVIPISCSETHLSIDAGMLSSGTYSYTLYVDGKVIYSKQMILTR